MIQMTTAEFGKANLTKIDDVVEIKRYNTVVGTFYPTGTVKVDAGTPDVDLVAAKVQVRLLEDEIKHLKRRLAEYAAKELVSSPLIKAIHPAGTARGQSDPFSGLPKQDREFFERKLGKKK